MKDSLNTYINHIVQQIRQFDWKKIANLRFLFISVSSLAGAAMLFIFGFYFSVSFGWLGEIPNETQLKNIQHQVASEIYSSDSVLLGKYYLQERTDIEYAQLPTSLIDALTSIEDARFFDHNGVDYKSLFRVVFKSILLQDESSGGGSTITQQLVKNIYPRQNHRWLSTPINKTREMIVAKKIEELYSKEEILTLYLNTVSFGENAFGIKTAAERFFNKSPNSLNIQESAVLVGLLKATNTYNPRLHPQRSLGRRNLVIRQMTRYEKLSENDADSISQLPLELDYRQYNHNEGLATYFREHLRSELVNWCKQQEKSDGTKYNLYTDGLKIYTTINSRMQKLAEEAIASHMGELQEIFDSHWENTKPWTSKPDILDHAIRNSQHYKKLRQNGLSHKQVMNKMNESYDMTLFTWQGEIQRKFSPIDSVKHYLQFLQAGFMAMDARQGDILAWVGGINHKYFKFDHVNIKTKRQIGSTFKPIVYAAGIEKGIKPCDFVSAKQVTYTKFDDWTPGNSNENYEGKYSVKGALTNSVNTVSVKVLKKGGISQTVSMAHEMGIKSDIPEVPSISLGTPNISLFEMVSAYAAFANRGTAVEAHYITSITDKDGNMIEAFQSKKSNRRAMSEKTADIMIEMLKNVVNNGTAQRLRTKYGLTNDIAGKTGTTQSHADGWFIGFTPDLVAGAWVGSDDPNIHFRSITYGQGAAMALPIWANFVQSLNKSTEYNKYVKTKFRRVSPEINDMMDCVDYKEKQLLIDDIFAKILKIRKSPEERRRNKQRRLRRRKKN